MNKLLTIGATLFLLIAVRFIFDEYPLVFVILVLVAAGVVFTLGDWVTALLVAASGFLLLYSKSLGMLALASSFYYVAVYESINLKNRIKELVLQKFGIKADVIQVLDSSPSVYDLQKYGVAGNAVDVLIHTQEEIHKVIFDTDTREVYLKEKIMAPVYGNDVKPLWGEITDVYEDGTPKVVTYYDTSNWVGRVDSFDEKGNRTIESWRRIHYRIEFWNPETSAWERLHDVPQFEEGTDVHSPVHE